MHRSLTCGMYNQFFGQLPGQKLSMYLLQSHSRLIFLESIPGYKCAHIVIQIVHEFFLILPLWL